MDGISAPQIGEIIEQGKQTAANAVKAAVSDTANTVAGQIGIGNEKGASNQATNSQNQTQQAEPLVNSSDSNLQSEQTAEMVRDYYSTSTPLNSMDSLRSQDEHQTQQKLQKVRHELQAQHDQVYYQPLFAYEQKQAERPAEVAQKEEEQKKIMELEQKKQENNVPLAVLRAQTSAEVKLAGAG